MNNAQQNNGIEFDIPRLAKEIQEITRTQFQEHQTKIDEVQDNSMQKMKNVAKDFDSKILDTTQKNLDVYNNKIAEKLLTMKQDIIDEVNKGRSIINIGEGITTSILVGNLDHPMFESVSQSLILMKRVMMVGPAGTGKTHMAAELATKMNLPFYKYSCSRDSSVHDLLGYKQPTSEIYLETVFLKAYENGGIFLVDEYDAMSGDMALFFNGVADNSQFISVPHRDIKPTAKKHKDFYLIMCGNTWGKGSHEFSGRDFQDQALMDRFRLSKHFINYHFDLEKTMCNNVGLSYSDVQNIRKKLEGFNSYLSTRNVEDMCKLYKLGKSLKEIVKVLSHDLEQQEIQILESIV